MYLKLKIHLHRMGRRDLLVLFLLALVFGRCPPETRASSASELPTMSSERLSQNNNNYQDNYTERKCRPMLNFGLPHSAATQTSKRSTTSDDNQQQQQQQHQQKLSQSIPDSFSFAIGDIDLPLTPTDGAGAASVGSSVQTAMKLLAAFDSQLYDDSEEKEGDQDADEEPRPHENNIIRFTGNKLSISGLNFTMLNVHLYPNGEPKFALGVNIANTTLSGRFLYDGPTRSLIAGDRAQLAAYYRMTIDGVLLTAASNLTKLEVVTGGAGWGYHDSRFRLATNELQMNISNLGYISIDILDGEDASRPTSSYMLRMLQRVLQKTIKRTYNKFEEYIRRTLELEGRRFLDCELTRFSPLLVDSSQQHNHRVPSEASPPPPPPPVAAQQTDLMRTKSPPADPLVALETEVAAKKVNSENLNSTYLDDVARILGTEIGNSQLSRIGLPDFEYQRGLFGSNANINFLNGSLLGLDNIRLIGETRVKLLGGHLIVNASVGWVNLRPQYNWTLYFGGVGQELAADRRLTPAVSPPNGGLNQLNVNAAQLDKTTKPRVPMARGFVAFNIKAIDFDAVISKSVRSQSQMVVDELTIRRLDGLKMDIGGLPGMNRLTRTVVNFFMGRLKQRLVGAIQPALKQELERTLNQLALFN